MKTQAWGWLAAAVMAAGLNASYHDGGLRWAHRIANQVEHNTSAVMALATGHADQFMTEARYVASPSELAPCRFAAAMERAQEHIIRSDVQFARVQVMSDRQMAQLARLHANRARMQAQFAAMRIPVVDFAPVVVTAPKIVCPRIRVNVPHSLHVTMPAVPEIHIDAPGAGPV
jgi:hypothetical protein